VLPELGHLAKLARRTPSPAPLPTHLDADGKARMVDVGDKPLTARVAEAQAVVSLTAEAQRHVVEGTAPKGDVLAVARIAGIQAAKRTSELVPLCHPIVLTSVEVDFAIEPNRIVVQTRARTTERTGVEMEALVAASVAALTIYDMLKAVDRSMSVGEVFLVKKTGGRHGDYVRGSE
jgi:cyclic pyranopterin monophosphate synthase